jgi:hypothetical protein
VDFSQSDPTPDHELPPAKGGVEIARTVRRKTTRARRSVACLMKMVRAVKPAD